MLVADRYRIHDQIASGGMSTVHRGELVGARGVIRMVAMKRLHTHLARDPEFVAMFLDEARIASRIRHPNVVATIDLVTEGPEVFVVMEYVEGETLARLVRMSVQSRRAVPPRITAGIFVAMLEGLHAAHETLDERGHPLGIVHRDLAPTNVLVGVDGFARLLDFGVAKAAGRSSETPPGMIKGRLAYMAPEQLLGQPVDRRSDTYSATVVLWETLVGRRLRPGRTVGEVVKAALEDASTPPSLERPSLGTRFDAIVARGLARDPALRFQTARQLADAIANAAEPATASVIGEWMAALHEVSAPGT